MGWPRISGNVLMEEADESSSEEDRLVSVSDSGSDSLSLNEPPGEFRV